MSLCVQYVLVCTICFCAYNMFLCLQYIFVCTICFCVYNMFLRVQYGFVYPIWFRVSNMFVCVQYGFVCPTCFCVYNMLLRVQNVFVCTICLECTIYTPGWGQVGVYPASPRECTFETSITELPRDSTYDIWHDGARLCGSCWGRVGVHSASRQAA